MATLLEVAFQQPLLVELQVAPHMGTHARTLWAFQRADVDPELVLDHHSGWRERVRSVASSVAEGETFRLCASLEMVTVICAGMCRGVTEGCFHSQQATTTAWS